jgi:hypothetical protein
MSTTNTMVSLAPIGGEPLTPIGGEPLAPYPSAGGTTSRMRLPTVCPTRPLSHPGTFKFDTLGTAPTTTAGPQVAIPLQGKGIHDEANSANFDEWGRMTANMGLEAPGATPLLQNIILYPYVNPATELLDSTDMPSALNVTPISTSTDGTQIWKITHNGVDTPSCASRSARGIRTVRRSPQDGKEPVSAKSHIGSQIPQMSVIFTKAAGSVASMMGEIRA